MRQVLKIIVIAFIVLFYCNVTIAAEKPLIIKGLYIGMDINEARNILTQLLGKEWKLSPVGNSEKVLEGYRFGNSDIFGIKNDKVGFYLKPNVGDRGFAIIDHYDNYEGYISCDINNDKVTRISFSGKLTDAFFSTSKINIYDFMSSFRANFDILVFDCIPSGWMYKSPNGYTIKIETSKLIDINKVPVEKVKPGKPVEEPKIKFD